MYWIAGSASASGKYTDCNVTDRDLWSCKPHSGEQPSSRMVVRWPPGHRAPGDDLQFHAVTKWKWWALRMGIPGFSKADYSNTTDAHKPKLRPLDIPAK